MQHVIVGVDLNGTIMAGDAANGKSTEDSLWQMLCEQTKGKWNAAATEDISFRRFIETVLCPTPSNPPNLTSAEITQRRQDLKQQRHQWYKQFPTYLQETNHPLTSAVLNQFSVLKAQLSQHHVFDSFILFIIHMQQSKQSFSLVLRTFGDDLDLVVAEITQRTGLVPDCSGHFEGDTLVLADGQRISDPQRIYQVFKQSQFCAVKDDYAYWQASHESPFFAKPFFFAHQQSSDLSMMFDDNVKKQIVRAAPVYGEVVRQDLAQAKLIGSGQLVDVDSFQALSNLGYFIEKYKTAKSNSEGRADKELQLVVYRDPSTFFKPAPLGTSGENDSANRTVPTGNF